MAEQIDQLLESPDQVLSTLNQDGTRRWLFPRLSKGRFWLRRRVLAYALMLLFNILPWLQIDGKPVMLLDVINREFIFFGRTFQSTETLLLTLLLLSIFFAVFLLTALLGRVWCGWACPQTVYLEYLYRPLERFIEGKSYAKGGKGMGVIRRACKWLLFLVVALHLSHTFLAYFVGGSTVVEWSLSSPAVHPAGFVIVWGTALMMLLNFGWFREQMCTLACPYGRFQSVLLDNNSLIIGYDEQRGEMRGRNQGGDCVDCNLCVATCPTGIDIRDGLQMECIACAECIDACDAVMDKVGKEPGLIRYGSQAGFAGGKTKWLRPRTLIYPVVLAIISGLFGFNVNQRQSAMVQTLRAQDVPFAVTESGAIRNLIRLRIDNRSSLARNYYLRTDSHHKLIGTPKDGYRIESGASRRVQFTVLSPASSFVNGQAELIIEVSDDDDYLHLHALPLLGPFAE